MENFEPQPPPAPQQPQPSYPPQPQHPLPQPSYPQPQQAAPYYQTQQVPQPQQPVPQQVPPQPLPYYQPQQMPQPQQVPLPYYQPQQLPQPLPQPMPQQPQYYQPYYPPQPVQQIPPQPTVQQPYQQPYPYPYPYPYQQAYYPPQPLPPSPAEIYKKDLRSRVMKIILALFGFYVVNILASVVVVLVTMLLSGTFGELVSTASQSPEAYAATTEDTIMESFPFGLASIVGIVTGSFMLLIARGKRMFTEDLTRVTNRVHVPDLFKMLALMLGINAVITILQVILVILGEVLGISPSESSPDIFVSYMNPMGILYVVLLGPIFEEIIFRGAILRSLQPFGQNFAIVVSSLLFGLYHLMLFQGIFAFFVGLIFAYCALRYSIKWSMLLHIANNGLAMIMMYVEPAVFVELGIYMIYLALALVAGLLGFKAFREQLRTGKPTNVNFATGTPLEALAWQAPPKPRPYAIAFSSAWLIVGLALSFLVSAAMQFA